MGGTGRSDCGEADDEAVHEARPGPLRWQRETRRRVPGEIRVSSPGMGNCREQKEECTPLCVHRSAGQNSVGDAHLPLVPVGIGEHAGIAPHLFRGLCDRLGSGFVGSAQQVVDLGLGG